MTEEIWNDIPDLPGFKISNLARVQSLAGEIFESSNDTTMHIKVGEYADIRVDYPMCMATTFHGKRPTGHRLAYRDGNRANVTADNLYWYKPVCRTLRLSTGKRLLGACIPVDVLNAEGTLQRTVPSLREAARLIGSTAPTISKLIQTGRALSGFKFKYSDCADIPYDMTISLETWASIPDTKYKVSDHFRIKSPTGTILKPATVGKSTVSYVIPGESSFRINAVKTALRLFRDFDPDAQTAISPPNFTLGLSSVHDFFIQDGLGTVQTFRAVEKASKVTDPDDQLVPVEVSTEALERYDRIMKGILNYRGGIQMDASKCLGPITMPKSAESIVVC